MSQKKTEVSEVSKHLTFTAYHLQEHFLRTSVLTYDLENRSTSPRPFYLGIPLDQNATISGADGVDFDEAAQRPIAILRMLAQQKRTRTLSVTEGLSRNTPVHDLTEKQLETILKQTSLPAAEVSVLKEALPRIKECEAAEAARVQAEGRSVSSRRTWIASGST